MTDIQLYQDRALEVISKIPWNEKVDIWSVGWIVRTAMFRATTTHDKRHVYLGTAGEWKSVPHHWGSRAISRADKRKLRIGLVRQEWCEPMSPGCVVLQSLFQALNNTM